MTEREYATVLVLVLVATAALAASAAATAATASPTTDDSVSGLQDASTISLENAAVKPGENVTVVVSTNADNVAGYQANITYDPSVVKVQSVSGTSAFDQPTWSVKNGKGRVFITQSKANGVDAPALARVTFYAVGDAGTQTDLQFVGADTFVNDADAQNVNVTTSPAIIRVTNDGVGAFDNTTSSSASSNGQSGLLGDTTVQVVGVGVVVAAGALGVYVTRFRG